MTRHEIPPEDPARAAEWLLAEYDATDIEELADSIGAVQAHRTICVLKTLLDGGSPMRVTAPDYRSRQVVAVTADTAATAALGPEPIPGSGPGATADDTTISWADFRAWERQLTTCTHPIRLRGRIDALDLATGELVPVYDTATQPGGALHVACGNRRETVCPACSQVYKRDARQLVRAGLAGGKGIPETITAHPCVFATFTAPSFGPVHARRMRGKTVLPCRPRRDANARRCPHGRDISCPTRHVEADPGSASRCAATATTTNQRCCSTPTRGDLWRRFITYLPRHLARLAGITRKTLFSQVRIRFVKVAEYQARGVVHFHAVIRLDAPRQGLPAPARRLHRRPAVRSIGQAAAGFTFPVEHGATRW